MVRLIVVATFVVASSAVAFADDAAARRHFEAGAKAYNLQRFDDALHEFQAAYEEHADPAFLFNIAQSQRQLRQYDAAVRSYRAYLHEQPNAHNRAEVTQLITEMDEALRAQHTAAAEPPSASPPTVTPATANESTPPIQYRDNGRAKRLAGIITADLGVGGVALGVVFALLSKSAGDSAYRPSSGIYDPAADDRQHSYRDAEIACFVVGGAMVVAGTTVWMLGRRQRHEPVVASVAK